MKLIHKKLYSRYEPFNLKKKTIKLQNCMLNQQLKQIQDKLKKLKLKKIISKEDEIEIKRIEDWFDQFDEEL